MELIQKIATLTFREFTQSDWDGFAGCESKNPLITEDEENIYIIDGDRLILIDLHQNDEGIYEENLFALMTVFN